MMRWFRAGRRERLRRQAADWIARLNGPHEARVRAEFERWYRANPDHAATFDRLSALFGMAGEMSFSQEPLRAEPPTGRHRAWPAGYAFAAVAAAAFVVLLAFVVLGARGAVPSALDGRQVAVFATAGESRQLRLADGSQVVLAPGSELAVNIDSAARRLQLKRGEGRFTVFHDDRPFVVTAAGTEIVARGTRFIVRLAEEETSVSLIEGRVEVSYPPPADRPERRVASLAPGQRLVVPAGLAPFATSPERATGSAPRVMIEFSDMPLAEVVAQISRQSALTIRFADPALGERRVTGAFPVNDAEGFARSVAAALGLAVERRADGELWLSEAQIATH